LRDRLALPTRKSFYVYAGILATLDLVQSIGAGILNYTQNPDYGLCIVDFTAAVYLTLFTPLVYHTFLSEFFGISQPSIMFSYKAQVDDAMDEDTVSLPHQQSFSSLKTDSDYIYQVHTPTHIPLYDSQALKSSRPAASLYSLTSAKDPKNNDSSTFDSPVKPYCSTSGIRSFGRDPNAQKDISEVTDYSLTKSAAIRKSVPDLSLSSPIRKTVPAAYGGPSSVSNLLRSTDTASNFFYKPNAIDSNINLFSQTRKNSLENISYKTTVDYATVIENVSREHDDSSEISQAPALENTLQSILESGTREIETENLQDSRLKTTTDSSVEVACTDTSCLTTRTEIFKTCSDDASSDLSDTSNVTQQLLPRATSLTTGAYRKSKYDPKEEGSGGLNDYLLSITSPKFVKHKKSETHPNSFPDSDFYTQTESL